MVAIATSITGSEEVVVASTTPGLQISSRLAKRAFLTLSSSTTASTTRSTSARWSSVADQLIRPSAASRSASASLPRTTPLFSEVFTASQTFADFSMPRVTETTS